MSDNYAVAARWWADRLRKDCKQSGLSAEERSSGENRAYEMSEMLMVMLRPRVSAEQADSFEKALTERIRAKNTRSLNVDYGPCSELEESLREAGISPTDNALPIKTYMIIEDTVQVSYGYRAPLIEVRGEIQQ